jgi:hypothetical protein
LLSKQLKEDGLALQKLREPAIWDALTRLVAQMNSDVIDRFTNEKEKKSWLKGSREAVGSFLPAIEQKIKDAEEASEESDQEQKILRGESADGSGDLAIG